MNCLCLKANGQLCTRKAQENSKFCWQHAKLCENPKLETSKSPSITEKSPLKSSPKSFPKSTPKSVSPLAPIFHGIDDIINDLKPSDKCSGNKYKVIPFLIRIGKKYPNRICNIRAGIMNAKIFNARVKILFKDGSAVPEIDMPLKFQQKLSTCKEPLVILSLSIESFIKGFTFSHANLLIIDRELKTLERFEPHGYFSRDPQGIIDYWVLDIVKKHLPSFKYIPPLDYCPKIGPQKANKSTFKSNNCEKGGYCVAWSTLYGHLRILNPDIPRQEIVQKMIEFANSPEYLRKYITYIDQIVTDDEITQFKAKLINYPL